jgi:hypothetical protein
MSGAHMDGLDTDVLPAPLPVAVLGRRIDGHQLDVGTLAELLDARTTLLVFLRHYG